MHTCTSWLKLAGGGTGVAAIGLATTATTMRCPAISCSKKLAGPEAMAQARAVLLQKLAD